jgi:transposase
MEEALQLRLNNRDYICVKKEGGDEFLYIFFCPQLFEDQIRKKERKFERQKAAGNKLLKKVRKHKPVERYTSEKSWVEFFPSVQAALKELDNTYITGIEGFFILESSMDAKPEKILRFYKARDKAERFIRNLKEGIELRPIWHWSKWAVMGGCLP